VDGTDFAGQNGAEISTFRLRFVPAGDVPAPTCVEAENRIKEQPALFYDCTNARSIAGIRSGPTSRLYFSSSACVLLDAIRRLPLARTRNARLQYDTLPSRRPLPRPPCERHDRHLTPFARIAAG